ncbi:MAG: T9SS type B sorting domain-containing protein [Flavobacteriaceae bacterium]|nr:gliding motility-associated C-terminal domain-containing protein [Bacteroidia bacterium]NNL62017.1 T9SS type B sorting domain-containing protein [Flavobacteriaceae bacterium]
MRKITLSIIMSLSALCVFSQVLDEPANWPNTNWTVGGTYNASALLNDPTITDAFTFDDDAAGSSSDDDIVAESPVLDLTAAFNANEILLLFTGIYNHRPLSGGVLDLQYWDADASTWIPIFDFVGNGGGSDYESCLSMQPYEAGLDISGFSATQLSGFKYRFSFDDADGWLWGFCIQQPVLLSTAPTPPNCDSVLTNPIDGAVDVNENEDLTWSPATNFPTGYKISIGTTSGGTDVANNIDVGNVLTYDPGTLNYATTYYVTITPYGSSGDATGCTEESFTTRDDPNVVVDCDAGPINTTYCYVNSDTMQFNFMSSSGFPLNILFNAGQVENNFDELIILDSDGVTDLNATTPYGNGGDLTGLTYTSTGDTLTVIIQSDGSINCQGNGYTPWDFDVWCQTCDTQTVDFSIDGSCEPTSEFNIDVNISDLGSASSITVNDNQGSDEQVTTNTGVLTFGPYPANTEVVITVANTDDANCIVTSLPLTFVCPPPPNECSIIYAGEDSIVDCENPSTDLTASFMTSGVNIVSYDINGLDTCPTPPLVGGAPTGIDIDDRWSQPIDLSFEFCFFGDTYDQVVIGANGLLTFDVGLAGQFCPWSFSDSVPSANLPLNAIFGAYHDIDPSVCGNIEYFILGSAPSRQFVVNFVNTCQFSCNDLESSQQIILYESSNNIDVNIIDKPTCATWNNGNAVIGVQNFDGSLGFTPPDRNTGPWTASNESWRFSLSGDPSYVFEWFDGTTSLGDTETISVTPMETTTYTASVSYVLCDGSTETITDDVTVEVEIPEINIVQPETIEECEDRTDGFLAFDLTGLDTTILNGLTDYGITYHLTQADADDGINAISSPNAYTNVSNPQMIYARAERNTNANCYETTSFELVVTNCVFPQGISPNNDGLNDSFDLSDYEVSSLEIYNRNGILVYSRRNYTNEWQGQSNEGSELPVGTYFYIMRYRDNIERSSWIYINK